jgi:hypothetical protein
LRVAVITMARPIRPPNSEGNSGPSSHAVSQYGTIIAAAAKSANGQIAKPSLKRLLAPKNRVSRLTMNRGTSRPTTPCMVAAVRATSPR